jgi:hypothetical protein
MRARIREVRPTRTARRASDSAASAPRWGKVEEKRKQERVPYVCEAQWVCEGHWIVQHGLMLDLSPKGAYVQTSDPCPKGTVVLLMFALDGTWLELEAMVIHHTQGASGMGLGFHNLSPDQAATLEKARRPR